MAASSLEAYHARANKRTQDLFGASSSESFLDANAPTAKRAKLSADSASDSTLDSADVKLSSRILASYSHVKDLPPPGTGRKADSSASLLNRLPSSSNADAQVSDANDDDSSSAIGAAVNRLTGLANGDSNGSSSFASAGALVKALPSSASQSALVKLGVKKLGDSGVPWEDEKPQWHAPWKLKSVITGGHVGWVRTVTVDPTNSWFATGSSDRTIKVWDLAARSLKLTLTGHIAGVRSLVASERHPYLFSAGEDRQVFCWDLETNKAIRHYYGHNAGVYTLALHPELDLLISGGRDRSVKVWDIRSRAPIYSFHNHTSTVHSVAAQASEPQVVSASADMTVRLWDLVAGKTRATLTNHSKGVRDVLLHPTENSMVSAGADNIKRWKFPDGNFINNFEHNAGTIQSVAINHENVMVSTSDLGTLQFWDWKTAHCFQTLETIVQPGSLASEACIYDAAFDKTGSRLITCEADKSIKIWAEDETATPTSHPLTWKPKRHATQW